MSDPPVLPSALGVEAVEVVPGDGGNLIVRVTARWRRRRRPDRHEPPVLVVEAEGARHRFPALLEPPSLTGILGGLWRMSFSVPADLSGQLVDRAWLQVGTEVTRLRVSPHVEPPAAAAPQPEHASPQPQPASPQPQHAEPQPPERPAGDIAHLQRDLEEARAQADRARAQLDRRERQHRAALQRAHAETSMRAELQVELAQQTDKLKSALGEVAALEARVRELERELRRLQRAVDEAEHAGAAARAARERSEVPLDKRAPTTEKPAFGHDLSAELALARARPPVPARAAPTAQPRPVHPALDAERLMIFRRRQLPNELRELQARSVRVFEALDELRDELRDLRAPRAQPTGPSGPPSGDTEPAAPATTPPDPSAPAPASAMAPEPPPRAALATPPERSPPPPATTPLEPERLSAALARLREATPAPTPQHALPVKPWLRDTFRRLTARDPELAGRLLLSLLEVQHLADPRPVAYDLVLSDASTVRVTSGRGATDVEFAEAPRSSAEVDFQLSGDVSQVVRLLLSQGMRRRFGRNLAKVSGDRGRLRALELLIAVPMSLRELHAHGVALDPPLALAVVAAMIDPRWTAGERFVVAHQVLGAAGLDAFLRVDDGRLETGTEGSETATTTLVCPPEALLPALVSGGEMISRGSQRPIELLAAWIARAQSA